MVLNEFGTWLCGVLTGLKYPPHVGTLTITSGTSISSSNHCCQPEMHFNGPGESLLTTSCMHTTLVGKNFRFSSMNACPDWYYIYQLRRRMITKHPIFSYSSILLKVHNQCHVPSQQQLCVNDFSMQIAISISDAVDVVRSAIAAPLHWEKKQVFWSWWMFWTITIADYYTPTIAQEPETKLFSLYFHSCEFFSRLSPLTPYCKTTLAAGQHMDSVQTLNDLRFTE